MRAIDPIRPPARAHREDTMTIPPRPRGRRPRRLSVLVEALEARSLLASGSPTFALPSLAGLNGGRNVPAAFARMVGTLQAQIEINAPKNADPAHLTGVVDGLVGQYEAASAALFASAPPLVALLTYQGEAIRSAIDSLDGQLVTGLISRRSFDSNAFMAIQELTLSRQVWPLGTPAQEFLVVSTETADELEAVAEGLRGVRPLADPTAAALVRAEAYSYQTEVLVGAGGNNLIVNSVIVADAQLISRVDAAVGSPDFASQAGSAVQGFADALINPGGLFGPGGAIGKTFPQPPTVPDPLSIGDAATFTNLQYREVVTAAPLVLHRNFTGASDQFGRFLSSDLFASPAQAVRNLALDQSWYGTNQASFVEDVTLPAGTTVYVGTVAPIFQGIYRREPRPSVYPGGSSQYLLANSRDPAITWTDLRATGT